jgi:catechol 2,3-dioxygenase-like lactoylglutathione lyase family enzyme
MTEPIFSGFNHFCVITADLDRAVATWTERYGVGPWTTFELAPGSSVSELDGEPSFGALIGLAQLGEHARVELIQPLGDAGLYAESLRAHGGADHFHHVRLDIDDFETARDRMDALGVPKLMHGRAATGVRAGTEAIYYDTRADLGVPVEIVRSPQDPA